MGCTVTRGMAHILRRCPLRAGRALMCAVVLAVAMPLVASADSATFDIPAQPLPSALKAFAAQAHMQLLYVYSDVENEQSNLVHGDLNTHVALAQLLRNTGFEIIYSSEAAATIKRGPVSTQGSHGAAEKKSDKQRSQGDTGAGMAPGSDGRAAQDTGQL